MKCSQTAIRKTIKPMLKSVALAALVMVLTLGVLVAHSLTKKRTFTGDIQFEVCLKKGSAYQVIDKLKLTRVSFDVSVAELASGKEVTTPITWECPPTEQGHKVSTRLSRPASAKFDPAQGSLQLEVPFALTIDGQRADCLVKFTTESLTTPTGSLTGKRAQISGRNATIALVGVGPIKSSRLAEILDIDQKAGSKPGARQLDRNPVGGVPEVALIVKAAGTITAGE